MSDHDLDSAYAIEGAEAAKALYDTWADTYDQSFAQTMGYVAPALIARVFLDEGGSDAGPILDIGAGTGLAAEALPGLEIDGVDISVEMLAVAGSKGLYRRRIEADLTARLPIADETYSGFISSGTFTHGHVGPVCLPELLRVAKSGALFVCGTRPEVYDAMGFGSAFASLVAKGMITPLRHREFKIYEDAVHDHAEDTGLVVIFRKT